MIINQENCIKELRLFGIFHFAQTNKQTKS